MKKLIAGLFAAILTTAGLVAVTSSVPASAACTQYVCNNTTTRPAVPKNVKAGKPVKVKVQVKVPNGNIKPKGTVSVSVKGPGGFRKTVKGTYNGGTVTLNLGKFKKPGVYKLAFTFKGGQGFRDSKSTKQITVKKKKKRG